MCLWEELGKKGKREGGKAVKIHRGYRLSYYTCVDKARKGNTQRGSDESSWE